MPPRVTVHLARLDGGLAPACRAPWPGAGPRPSEEVPNRAAFPAARKWLRALLAERLGCSPAEVPIVLRPDGKPCLAGGGIEFSLSHCDDWCAVAWSADCPVGVDVELVRPLDGIPEVVEQFFPPAARAAYSAASPRRKLAEFFRQWTRIEAAVKASGRGLDDQLSLFDGVWTESCQTLRGLALAVAARTARPVVVDWKILSWNAQRPAKRTSLQRQKFEWGRRHEPALGHWRRAR